MSLLIRALQLARHFVGHRDRLIFVDRYGDPAIIPAELLYLARLADDRNEVIGQECLRYRFEMTQQGIRKIIDIAHSEPDPDIAFLTVVANWTWADTLADPD